MVFSISLFGFRATTGCAEDLILAPHWGITLGGLWTPKGREWTQVECVQSTCPTCWIISLVPLTDICWWECWCIDWWDCFISPYKIFFYEFAISKELKPQWWRDIGFANMEIQHKSKVGIKLKLAINYPQGYSMLWKNITWCNKSEPKDYLARDS